MTVIEFPAPDKLLNANDRQHWAARAARVRAWRHAARSHACTLPAQPPSIVHLTLPVRDKRRRDPHNTWPTLKALIDGLVDAGLWPDDTPEYVRTMEPLLVVGGNVIIRLEPMEAPQ